MAIIKIGNPAIDLDAAEIPNLDTAKITTGQFTDSRIADVAATKITGTITPSDSTVSLDKLTATGTKDATTFLRGDNTFASAGGTNTPAFHATMSANQNITQNADTLVQFDTETFDTNNNFNTSTYRFTPTTSGKYFVYTSLRHDWSGNWGTAQGNLIYKNAGIAFLNILYSYSTSTSNYGTNYVAGVISMNGSTDYLSVYAYSNATSPQVWTGAGTFFGAYKIIE
jgi:hypothetical protein